MRAVAAPVAIVLLATGSVACRRPAAAPESREITLGQTTSAATLDPHGRDLSQTSITLSHFYAVRQGLEFHPRLDRRVRAFEVRPAS